MQVEGRVQEQTRAITILLADDHAMFREGLAAVVQRVPDIHVVGECADGNEVLPAVLQLRPEVLEQEGLINPSPEGAITTEKLSEFYERVVAILDRMEDTVGKLKGELEEESRKNAKD